MMDGTDSPIMETFGQERLEPHNRSLGLINRVIEDVGATVEVGSEYRQYGKESLAIRVSGSSGVNYRISVHFNRRVARLMRHRRNEMDFDGSSCIGAFMNPFRGMMEFDIHWHDLRDGDWRHICLHDRRDVPMECWPGDHVATTIQLLNDDLNSALLPEMSTLRRELRIAYPIAWAAGHTPSEVKFSQVANYVTDLELLDEASTLDEFMELREAM